MEAPRSRSGLSTFMICCLYVGGACLSHLRPTNHVASMVPCNDDEASISAKQCLHNQLFPTNSFKIASSNPP
eukprot:scaffold7275_cov80-Skeletonema_menzelii.AAC.1